ncbi:hypothetical protein TH9_12405 [Thalassospira xiamenensis]|nr:hypothetical protein TH9_12405 [Thalassospira xiamenensis]
MQVCAGKFAQACAFRVIFGDRRINRVGCQKLVAQALKHPFFQIFHFNPVCIVAGSAFAAGVACHCRSVGDGEGAAAHSAADKPGKGMFRTALFCDGIQFADRGLACLRCIP